VPKTEEERAVFQNTVGLKINGYNILITTAKLNGHFTDRLSHILCT
jgi:hypothetical protein